MNRGLLTTALDKAPIMVLVFVLHTQNKVPLLIVLITDNWGKMCNKKEEGHGALFLVQVLPSSLFQSGSITSERASTL